MKFNTKLRVHEQQNFIFELIKERTKRSGVEDSILIKLKEKETVLVNKLKTIQNEIRTFQKKESETCSHFNSKIEKFSESYGCDYDGYQNYL